MAQFRSTADILDRVLTRCGELTDGTSAYEADALGYLNKVHHTIIAGGNEFNTEIDEVWTWAKARRPLILELQPALETGSVSLTQGLESGAFSAAPAYSVEGWYLKVTNEDDYFKIISHTAGQTAFELDAAFTGTTGSALTFKCFKLEYDLIASYLIVDNFNDKLDFIESGTTELTATLTHGSYTPAQLATHVAAQLNVAGGTPAYTCTYDSVSRKFTLGSDRASSAVFKLQGGSGTNAQRSALELLGFDAEDLSDAASHTSVYALSSLVRFISPFKIYKRNSSGFSPEFTGNVFGVDELSFQRDFPLIDLLQGMPTKFCKVAERADGTVTVKFNRYPQNKTRVELEYIPVPRDLKDNANSIPLVPRKYIDVLEYGACYFIALDKSDDMKKDYAQLAQQKLQAMMKQNRKELQRTSRYFGQTIARLDMTAKVRKLIYGEPQGT